ncbi:MAG: DUF1028 domain-containing protein [Aggregatilineales bacterium]
MTYSIVGYDAQEAAWGVAVASKFLAVGSVVSWAQAGVGAVATQAWARVSFGRDGLALMAEGHSAEETLNTLLAADPGSASRQVGIVDAQGRAAAHTGAECLDWAGHLTGAGFACQGNILAGPEVLTAMSAAFQSAAGELADRLIAALLAGEQAGGDRRGRQSAALLVVKAGGGYGGDNDRYLDLRVDDDTDPVRRLAGLVAMHHLFFGEPRPEDQLPITSELAEELQVLLIEQGYAQGPADGQWDDQWIAAFDRLIGNENLEERWRGRDTPHLIDRVALQYLRERFARR